MRKILQLMLPSHLLESHNQPSKFELVDFIIKGDCYEIIKGLL